MIKFKDGFTVYFDVDSTLLFTRRDVPEHLQTEENEVWINGHCFYKHAEHVEFLKDFKGRGQVVVVWSQGGSDWAEMAVEHLNIKQYVDLVICKPHCYVDDLKAEQFMTNRAYFDL